MKKRVYAFLDNDSAFGRLMQKCWILIGSNLMFMLFSLPVITIGPSLAALYHVQLKSMRGYEDLNPIREFWTGFRNNFKQAILFWIFFLLAAFIAVTDIRFLIGQNGVMEYLRYMVYFITAAVLAVSCIMFPVMAAFADTFGGLIRNAVYFAGKNPARAILIAALNVVPLALTYMDAQRMPLYGFLWVVFGFAAVSRIVSVLLIGDFNKFLPPIETET